MRLCGYACGRIPYVGKYEPLSAISREPRCRQKEISGNLRINNVWLCSAWKENAGFFRIKRRQRVCPQTYNRRDHKKLLVVIIIAVLKVYIRGRILHVVGKGVIDIQFPVIRFGEIEFHTDGISVFIIIHGIGA